MERLLYVKLCFYSQVSIPTPLPAKPWLSLRGGQVLMMGAEGRGNTNTKQQSSDSLDQELQAPVLLREPLEQNSCRWSRVLCFNSGKEGCQPGLTSVNVCTTQSWDGHWVNTAPQSLDSVLIHSVTFTFSPRLSCPSVKWAWEIILTPRGGSHDLTHLNTLYKL